MKILFQINSVVNFGSTGRIVEGIGNHAIFDGWESYIAYGRWAYKSNSKLIRIGKGIDIHFHLLQTRLFDRHGLSSMRATHNLVKRIQEIKPDIIHLHNIHGYYLNYKILFSFLSQINIPVVWTLHDCWAFTGHCAFYSFVNCNKWKSSCEKCLLKRKYPESLLFDRSKKNYEDKSKAFNSVQNSNLFLVPVSYWLQAELKHSFLSLYPTEVIHNGIDIEVFKPTLVNKKQYGNFDNKFIILGVASFWTKRKGLQDFVKLSKRILLDTVIVLVGVTKEQQSLLPDNIISFTRTENVKQLVDLYSMADVFVNPTWEDNYPTTNLEALACGTPVITYNTGGSIESVTQDTGFIVPQGDIEALLFAVNSVKKCTKSFYEGKCRKYALQHFNYKDRYNDYINLYQRLLAKK